MIKIKADAEPVDFITSTFPDGTSQCWRLTKDIKSARYVKIDFIWENKEVEIFHLFQLIDLIRASTEDAYIYLNSPYMPYARQDKPVTSEATFALTTFANLLNTKKIEVIATFDVHSKVAKKLIKNLTVINPSEFHNWAWNQFKPDYAFYPDEGAAKRYGTGQINEIMLYGEKVRNQLTGSIDGYRIVNGSFFDIKNKKILIFDDICDGGATFITAAKALKELGVSEIGLCVSHGIFSKGKQPLIDAGISQFFYTNSLVYNKDGYKVWE